MIGKEVVFLGGTLYSLLEGLYGITIVVSSGIIVITPVECYSSKLIKLERYPCKLASPLLNLFICIFCWTCRGCNMTLDPTLSLLVRDIKSDHIQNICAAPPHALY